MQIPPKCRILISSPSKKFKGLKGLSNLEAMHKMNESQNDES